MQLPLYPLIRFYFQSTSTRNLKGKIYPTRRVTARTIQPHSKTTVNRGQGCSPWEIHARPQTNGPYFALELLTST